LEAGRGDRCDWRRSAVTSCRLASHLHNSWRIAACQLFPAEDRLCIWRMRHGDCMGFLRVARVSNGSQKVTGFRRLPASTPHSPAAFPSGSERACWWGYVLNAGSHLARLGSQRLALDGKRLELGFLPRICRSRCERLPRALLCLQVALLRLRLAANWEPPVYAPCANK